MSLRAAALLTVLVALLGPAPARALAPCAAPPPPEPPAGRVPTDLATHLAQARLFAKRGWDDDAAAELALARTAPGAGESVELHTVLAELALVADDHQAALCFATVAARLAPDDPVAARTVRQLETEVGALRVVGPEDGLVTRMQLDPLDPLTSERERQSVDRVALGLREKTRLPVTVTLPIGRYAVNGVEVEVVAERPTRLALPASATGARGLAALQVTRAEASAGVWIVPGTALPELSPTAELGLTFPLGLVLLGGVIDAQLPTGFGVLGRSERDRTPVAFTGGLRLGADLITGLPLAIRPSLVLRGGQVAGLGRACTADGRCGAPGVAGDAESTALHTMAWALMPGAELSVDHREAGRSAAAGFGLKAGVDQIIAWGPTSGSAPSPAGAFAWTADGAPWRGVGVRVLANASFAF